MIQEGFKLIIPDSPGTDFPKELTIQTVKHVRGEITLTDGKKIFYLQFLRSYDRDEFELDKVYDGILYAKGKKPFQVNIKFLIQDPEKKKDKIQELRKKSVIVCPNCGKEYPLTQAGIIHTLTEVPLSFNCDNCGQNIKIQ